MLTLPLYQIGQNSSEIQVSSMCERLSIPGGPLGQLLIGVSTLSLSESVCCACSLWESKYISGGWWFLKCGRKDCVLGCHWPAWTVGVWGNKNVRLKVFQGVLVNYKIVGRDSYVNTIDTKPPVASL
jgi:hypothetical protein